MDLGLGFDLGLETFEMPLFLHKKESDLGLGHGLGLELGSKKESDLWLGHGLE
jgi:hypothetical protein